MSTYLSTTRKWLRRNRTNFAVGFGLLGVGYVATQYVYSKITEARERMSDDRIGKENLRRRFEQNQEDCTFTVLALLPTATENILEALSVESITQELQYKRAERLGRSSGTSEVASDLSSGTPSVADDDGKSLSSFRTESYVHASQMADSQGESGEGQKEPQRPRKSKVQLWNDLKINSITRAFTLLYTLSLLTLLTRIQLNLLGRRNYLSSVVSLASHPQHKTTKISLENRDDDNLEQAYGNDFETNRQYLTFSWWLLHRGWKEVMNKVEVAVKDIFGPLNPREDVTLERLSELTLEVRKKVEGITEQERRESKWLSYLLPPQDQEDFVLRESGMSASSQQPATPETSTTNPLRRLLDETSDLIDSPPFTHVLTKLLDASFSILVDQKLATQAFKTPPTTTDPNQRIQELIGGNTNEDGVKTKLANVLAVMSRQAHNIGNGVPNEYLQAMEEVRDLEGFAAIVYSSNFEFEAPGTGAATTAPLGGEAAERAGPDAETGDGVDGEGESGGGEGGFEDAWGKALVEKANEGRPT